MHLSRGRTRSVPGIRKLTVTLTSKMERSKSPELGKTTRKCLLLDRREIMNDFLSRVEML